MRGSVQKAAFSRMPAVDVTETGKGSKVVAELPGMDEKNIEVKIANGMLTGNRNPVAPRGFSLVKAYFDTVGKQIEQQQATFRDVAAAQIKASHEAADKLHDSAVKMAAAKLAELDATVKEMKTQAFEAEARLQKLRQARDESWSALSAALAGSRKAFNRANQALWDAFKRATSPSLG
jgi:hypothetical protein